MPAFLKSLLLSLLAVLLIALGAVDPAPAAGPVVVASKIDTEGALLGNMIADRARGARRSGRAQASSSVRPISCAPRSSPGRSTSIPNTPATARCSFTARPIRCGRTPSAGYAAVKQLDAEENRLVWLPPAPANNTWVIAIRGDLAGLPARQMPRRSGRAICARAAGSSSPPRPNSSRARRHCRLSRRPMGFSSGPTSC